MLDNKIVNFHHKINDMYAPNYEDGSHKELSDLRQENEMLKRVIKALTDNTENGVLYRKILSEMKQDELRGFWMP